ncbi:MAG TPA: putative porin [Candidatus Marinimicrobia bacterium]|nr:putative porin [Candidatus Neomarinimicrobiota bacterium]HRS52046.1 putative porin [Candidatus Neomarinimicrobiota bacterium]HRU93092.1 putative porin [Candidatus Neomarinimicrobiota bacterium]
MKMRTWKINAILAMLGFCALTLNAGELDRLVNELVDKGVLDAGKAQEILTLTEEEMRAEMNAGKVTTLPTWIQTLNLKGDFRFRNQWEATEDDSVSRMRQRIRFRLNGEAAVTPSFKVGFGLATGSNDPRSTNQTLDNSFETKPIMLDYAYGSYTFPKYANVLLGKFYSNLAFWTPTDYMWDSDITVEGVAALFNHKKLFLNTGIYFLDEKGKVEDVIADNPRMLVLQPGFNLAKEGKYSLKAAATYYHFNKTKDLAFDHAKWSNSYYTVGGSKYLTMGYNNFNFATDVAIYSIIFPYIGVSFEINQNLQAESDTAKNGIACGLTFGSEKIKDKGQWQVKYVYRKLEKDAWLDFLPDSDTYGGKTDIKGSELIAQYGLRKNVVLALDYYKIENLHGAIEPETLLQADIQFKF